MTSFFTALMLFLAPFVGAITVNDRPTDSAQQMISNDAGSEYNYWRCKDPDPEVDGRCYGN